MRPVAGLRRAAAKSGRSVERPAATAAAARSVFFQNREHFAGPLDDRPPAARRAWRPGCRRSGRRRPRLTRCRNTISSCHSLTSMVTLATRGEASGERRQLMVVRREQHARLRDVVQVLDGGPGDREAVEGCRAAPDLVEDDERALRRLVEDAAVSTISTMNVERPRARSSAAPTRLNSRSTTPIVRRRAPARTSPSAPGWR